MWSARIDGVDHKIELDHGIWSGRRRLVVDGWDVHDTTRLFDLGGDVRFAVAGHQGLLRIAPRSLGYVYAIALDGLWVNGGGLVTYLPQFVRFASYAMVAHALFLLAIAAIWPGDLVNLVLLVGLRSIAATYVALPRIGRSGAVAHDAVRHEHQHVDFDVAVDRRVRDRPLAIGEDETAPACRDADHGDGQGLGFRRRALPCVRVGAVHAREIVDAQERLRAL